MNSKKDKGRSVLSKIIAIANQKGGVGKSTTAINLSASLAEMGRRILVIDLDAQANTTSGLGVDKNEPEHSLYDIMTDEASWKECVLKEVIENLDLIPSNVNVSGLEIELTDAEDKEYILKNAMKGHVKKYDYVIMDCPPSLSLLTINALCAADSVLVPIQCEYYALEGLSQLTYTINLVKERLNDKLKIEGVVFTMFDVRNRLSQQVVENVKANLDQPIFDTVIPRNVRLAEAPSYGMPINQYDSRSSGAFSYRKLAKELVRRTK